MAGHMRPLEFFSRSESAANLLAMVLVAVVFLFPYCARGCAAPVFRYVLERWPADTCQLVIFHHGPMRPQDLKLEEMLKERSTNATVQLNVAVRWTETENLTDPVLLEVWRPMAENPQPWAVLLYPGASATPRMEMPRGAPARRGRPQAALPPPGAAAASQMMSTKVAWAGPAHAEEINEVLGSPMRREIAQRILAGDSAVWLFVGSENPLQDVPVLNMLSNQLARLEKDMQLPPDEPGAVVPSDEQVRSAIPLRVTFPVLTINRTNAAERAFLHMLDHASEPPLSENIAHVFVIFGKGRILNGVTAEALRPDSIRETCRFLSQSCSCMAKDQVMGMSVHVPLAAAWHQVDRPAEQPELSVPMLPVRPGGRPMAGQR